MNATVTPTEPTPTEQPSESTGQPVIPSQPPTQPTVTVPTEQTQTLPDSTTAPDSSASIVSTNTTPATTTTTVTTKKPAKKKTVLTDTKNKCKVTVTSSTISNPTVAYTKSTNTKATSVKIPDTVKIGGVTYKVTSVAANAFANNKKLTKVTIGKNVTVNRKEGFQKLYKIKDSNHSVYRLKNHWSRGIPRGQEADNNYLEVNKANCKIRFQNSIEGNQQ